MSQRVHDAPRPSQLLRRLDLPHRSRNMAFRLNASRPLRDGAGILDDLPDLEMRNQRHFRPSTRLGTTLHAYTLNPCPIGRIPRAPSNDKVYHIFGSSNRFSPNIQDSQVPNTSSDALKLSSYKAVACARYRPTWRSTSLQRASIVQQKTSALQDLSSYSSSPLASDRCRPDIFGIAQRSFKSVRDHSAQESEWRFTRRTRTQDRKIPSFWLGIRSIAGSSDRRLPRRGALSSDATIRPTCAAIAKTTTTVKHRPAATPEC